MYDIPNDIIETAKTGRGIGKEQFERLLADMTDSASQIANIYEKFFSDIVKGGEQYVVFEAIGDTETEINRWYETTYASFYKIREMFGDEICKRLADSVLDAVALYPQEMKGAAEFLVNNSQLSDLNTAVLEDTLYDTEWGFPQISDLIEEKTVWDDEEFER